MVSQIFYQIDHRRADGNIEPVLKIGYGVGGNVFDRAITTSRTGDFDRTAGQIDANGLAEFVLVVQLAQESTLVATKIQQDFVCKANVKGLRGNSLPELAMLVLHRLVTNIGFSPPLFNHFHELRLLWQFLCTYLLY